MSELSENVRIIIKINMLIFNKNLIYVLNEKLKIPLYKGGKLNQDKGLISKYLHHHKLMLLCHDSKERK